MLSSNKQKSKNKDEQKILAIIKIPSTVRMITRTFKMEFAEMYIHRITRIDF